MRVIFSCLKCRGCFTQGGPAAAAQGSGTTFTVDCFSKRANQLPGRSRFLTHFHTDQYSSLTSSFSAGGATRAARPARPDLTCAPDAPGTCMLLALVDGRWWNLIPSTPIALLERVREWLGHTAPVWGHRSGIWIRRCAPCPALSMTCGKETPSLRWDCLTYPPNLLSFVCSSLGCADLAA